MPAPAHRPSPSCRRARPVVHRALAALALGVVLASGCGREEDAAELYDLVLAGGRVMDPESGLDDVRHVGIRGGSVAALSQQPLQGAEVVDVTGLVVAPGFIDLHAHGQDDFANGLQARDGVTTALEMETGVFAVAPWYASREGRSVTHFGATVSHIGVRTMVMHGTELGHVASSLGAVASLGPRPDAVYRAATPQEASTMRELMLSGLDQGALGFGFGINYTPAADSAEIDLLFAGAAGRSAPVFVHTRAFGVAAVLEAIATAERTGTALHVVHIGSSTLWQVREALAAIDEARERGVDVTTEVYPYTAASTDIASAIFDEGWRSALRIDYGDLEWAATGERLTAESFRRYREQGGWVILHMIPEETVEAALAHPGVMVASDGVPFVDGKGHPRGAGTFARVLGRYVRERGTLELMDALSRMTLLPARRLEAVSPAMRNKGRVRVGGDADLVVFDPATVEDRATFEEPTRPSAGIPHVIVDGTFVVRDGAPVAGVAPGTAVRSGGG